VTPDDILAAKRKGFLLRVDSDPPIRIWGGAVRDIEIPAGGAETTDNAVYQSRGELKGIPQLGAALNGDADRAQFTVSGLGISGAVAALAHAGRSQVRGRAVDVGLVLFDKDWQVAGTPFWLSSWTADTLNIVRGSSGNKPTRAIQLGGGNIFTGRRRPNLSFFTDIDQQRRTPGDLFCSEVGKLSEGATVVWGVS
jgi:hypothetical protein